jgi:hypothetical protein
MDEFENDSPVNGDDASEVINGGVGVGDAEEQGNSDAELKDDPYGIKKRLGMQAKKHQREMRMMQEQMQQMQAHIGGNQQNQGIQHDTNPYPSPGQPNPPGMNEEQRIQQAVRMAFGMKEQEERKAKEAEQMQHIHKQYQRLNSEFDKASDTYDDFDDVVRGDDAPFTHHVRDALLLVDNPAEVAYKLGKNRSELERIAKLHPLEQAREVNKLSFALMGNGNKAQTSSQKANPMGQVRANPASSQAITDRTPASVIRARMKAGTWK